MRKSAIILFLFCLLGSTCFANEGAPKVAQPIPWPDKYTGTTIPLFAGNISFAVPTNITGISCTDEGISIHFENKSILGIKRIDGGFYKTREIPQGIASDNGLSVSFAGKIPYTYTAIPTNVEQNSKDFPIWNFGIAMRSIIYSGDNIVNSMRAGTIEIFTYYSPSAKAPYVAEVHTSNEEEYLLVTASGFDIATFKGILGTVAKLH